MRDPRPLIEQADQFGVNEVDCPAPAPQGRASVFGVFPHFGS